MRIVKIVVQNFRSVEDADVEAEGFNFFVGQNNHGKTNFFDAIDYFYNGVPKGCGIDDIRFKKDKSKDVEVSIEFTDLQSGLESMKNEKNQTSIENVLNESDNIIISRRNDEKWKITINGEQLEKNPTGIESALKDFLPRLEYVKTKKYFDDVGKFDKKTPIVIMLSGVLAKIIEEDDKYRVLKEKFSELFEGEDSTVSKEVKRLESSVEHYLQKQFPDCTEVQFDISPPQFAEYMKNFETHVDDGVKTTVSDKGDGMQRAVMLAIIQAYADHRKKGEDEGKSFIFMIDEAELHLHPTAQRMLKQALYEICSSGDQVFVNTHSSVMITDNLEKQRLFKVEKLDGATSVTQVDDESERQNIVYDLLGGSPTDLLLPPNFLIVEGAAEGVFLNRVIKRFYLEKPNVKLIEADGFASQAGRLANAIRKLYAPLQPIYGGKVVVLLDQPNARNLEEFNDFRATYAEMDSSGRLFSLPVDGLEDYYPPELVDGKNKNEKVKLARYAGNNITQADFEGRMVECFRALEKSWALAYGMGHRESERQAA